MEKKLYRSRDDRMLAGVCGGLAKYFGMDPVLVRVLAVVAVFVSFSLAILAYIILAVVVPVENGTNTNSGINQGRS